MKIEVDIEEQRKQVRRGRNRSVGKNEVGNRVYHILV